MFLVLVYTNIDVKCFISSTTYANMSYHQTSNISGTLVDNKLADHPDAVGASPVDAATTTISFST